MGERPARAEWGRRNSAGGARSPKDGAVAFEAKAWTPLTSPGSVTVTVSPFVGAVVPALLMKLNAGTPAMMLCMRRRVPLTATGPVFIAGASGVAMELAGRRSTYR